MKKRRSLTHSEQVTTLKEFLAKRRWTQVVFIEWLGLKGITITAQYLSDVINNRRNPGPKFKAIFKEITGITLVDGLIEDREGKEK